MIIFAQSCNGRRCSNCYYFSIMKSEKKCTLKNKKIVNRRNCASHVYYDEVPKITKEIHQLEE